MSASVVGIEKPVVIDRKQNLREHRLYWVGRRTQDVVLSALALVVLSPVMLATAIAIVVDDPSAGPVFSQERIGRDGKPFRFYKFRSMCPNAEAKLDDLLGQNEMDGPVFKIKDDPRITRVGKFIRKTSLDELPQLWNILKGDMSIVGPRPALPREVEQYGDYEKQRLYVTPGLSCYWQIAPHRNDLSFEEWMDLDVKYVKERSFWVDWKIIFKTFQCKRKKGTTPCSYHTVPEKMVMMVAMKQIHHLVSTMCEEEKMVKEMLNNGGLDSTRSIKVKENSIAFRIQETEERRLRLYEDYKAEILDEEEYSQLKEHYIAEKQRLEQELQKQRQRSLELEKRMRICDEQMERMRAILNQKEFDEELVHELIKKIYVGIDNSVEIEFKCSDPYQEVLAFVAEVQNE